MAEVPMARNLFVCEQVIVDHYTRNVSLINCTSGWAIDQFPSDLQRFCVYAILSNGLGNCAMRVRIVHLTDESEIFERRIDYRFSDPLSVLKFNLRIRQCIFPEEGRYAVQLFANDEQIAETVLQIDSTEE